MNPKWRFAFLLAAAVWSFTGSSQATLISVDSVFGPGTITRDSASGLDWLDLPVTSGQSINNILPQLATGQKFADFHFATDEDLGRLFLDAGFATSSGIGSPNPNDVAIAANLISLLGQTFSFPIGNDTFSGSSGFLLQSGILPGPNPSTFVFQVGRVGVRAPCSNESAPACASWQPLPELIPPNGEPHDSPGTSFLIRTSPITPIPEPTPLFLTGSGLALLLFRLGKLVVNSLVLTRRSRQLSAAGL